MPGLTITRELLEKVTIGDTVVTIVEIKGRRVTLNIVAPSHLPIRRLDAEGHDEYRGNREEK